MKTHPHTEIKVSSRLSVFRHPKVWQDVLLVLVFFSSTKTCSHDSPSF